MTTLNFSRLVSSLRLLILAITFAAGIQSAKAADEPGSYLGVMFGGNKTPNTSDSFNPTYGITLGGKISPVIGLGFFGNYFGHDSTGSFLGLPTGSSTRNFVLAGQLNYSIGGLFFGGEAGAAITSWSGNISSIHSGSSDTSFVYGPVAGYDIVINNSISVGAQAHYLVSTTNSGRDNLQVFAALKFWR